ncbi:YihY/virulence factor BrkB family protein [Defluviimonas sp. SAOS-178_SWC]|uniref:YihY/virulence factor BrkB family protein n=1 Tax=Defluviimonas sp. SAOS-178_SWC TaxID=3121287 RepID=UPI0032216378
MINPAYLLRLANAVWHAMDERNLGLIAAGVAFYTMFAIFPGMAATIAIWGFFADPVVMRDYLDQIHGLIPDAAYGVIENQLTTLLATNSSTLGWTTAVSLAVALYSVHNGVAALVTGLNAIHARRHRPGLMRILGSILLTMTLIALVLSALVVVVLVPILLNVIPLGPAEGFILRYLPWVVMFLVLMIVLGLFYRWGPNMEDERHSWLTPGAILAALLWAGASMAFSAYLTNFGSYNRIYGSIGAVIALLMWLYISAYIVLFGAVLNAERERLSRAQ